MTDLYYCADDSRVYTTGELFDIYTVARDYDHELTARGEFSDWLQSAMYENGGELLPVDPETMLYDIEGGAVVLLSDLEKEFLSLKEDDPETYDYGFSAYIENCLSATLSRF